MSAFEAIAGAGGQRCTLLIDEASGLRAIMAIDSLALGPAAGGIRTQRYATEGEAIAEAVRLAAAMTLKCAIAGLDAGGGKTVVLDHPGLDRPAAFRRLGAFIEELGGLYHAAGDLGTTPDDLSAAASATKFIHTKSDSLSEAAGRAVLRCIEACVEARGLSGVRGLRVAVQGCGAMGGGVARALGNQGAHLIVADTDVSRASALAEEVGGAVASAEVILAADVDIVAPCAGGGVLTRPVVEAIRAWAICGAANNQIAGVGVPELLAERGIMYVPDFLASAGAVIRGIGGAKSDHLVEQLRDTTALVLRRARETGRPSAAIATEIARARVARGAHGHVSS